MIPFARPWIGEEEAAAARRAILSGWITQGPEVAAFEQEFSAAVGAPHACAVSNCTAALHMALVAVGVAPGDEVITVSHSFIATANAVRQAGALPVFVDVDAATLNIDPQLVDAAVSERTRAVLCVHQLGMPCDIGALARVARARGVALIEDAACAVGSQVRGSSGWEPIGRPHGDIACFSFHPRKLLSTGDGGMLTTRRADLDARFRLLRHHGMTVSDTARHAATTLVAETYAEPAYNYRMTDIQAAVGREQLKRLPAMVERRRELAARYAALLHEVEDVTAPCEPPWARTNWQSYAVRLAAGLDQRAVMQQMLDDGVATRRGVTTAHREPAYPPGTWRTTNAGLRRSELAQEATILLPLYHELTAAEQDRVVESLARACARSRTT
ncbi:MAG: DegT/DnrJ/EryC1/StrS family aminotransferase [Acidimicrobiia bacterium]|nr:DegT/DnrJ/EryC1/StrS family aminotransferase [Acidimicrobiia bacterium]